MRQPFSLRLYPKERRGSRFREQGSLSGKGGILLLPKFDPVRDGTFKGGIVIIGSKGVVDGSPLRLIVIGVVGVVVVLVGVPTSELASDGCLVRGGTCTIRKSESTLCWPLSLKHDKMPSPGWGADEPVEPILSAR